MLKINNKTDCCGCNACYNICPQNAISMIEDEKGFKYPVIDREKCINCGLCEKVCPILNKQIIKREQVAYAIKNNDEEIRKNSSSGGVFYLLAKYFIENHGIVCGASFNKDFGVEHICIDNESEIEKLMTSKYIQSDIGSSYTKVKKYLDDGKLVLFTGTPCQIEGLITYLCKDYTNLYTQDIICHGVPSPKIWKRYLEYIEETNNIDGKPIEVNFRKKSPSWNAYNLNIIYNSKKSYNCNHSNDKYMKLFLKNYIIRDSCFDCKFKKYERISDITLADFWGINQIIPNMEDDKGTSLVIAHTEKGKELIKKVSNNCQVISTNLDKAIKYNSSYIESAPMPKNREMFFKDIEKIGFEKAIDKYTKKPNLIKRLFAKIGKVKKIIIFLIIFILLVNFTSVVFNPSGTVNEWLQSRAITQYYNLKKNSIGVLFLGDSLVYSDISPYEIYKDNNIMSYDLATPSQFIWSSYYLLNEAYKTQKPKLVFLSTDSLIYGKEHESEIEKSKSIDSIKISINKIEMINDDEYNFNNFEKLSTIFPVLKYHNRWNGNIGEEDFKKFEKEEEGMYKGQYINNIQKAYKVKEGNNIEPKIPSECKEYLKKIKKICDNNNSKLILIRLPERTDFKDAKEEIKELSNQLNIEFLDLHDDYITNINWNTDTRDEGEHLNSNGAIKISKIVEKFITERYKIDEYKDSEWDYGLRIYEFLLNS